MISARSQILSLNTQPIEQSKFDQKQVLPENIHISSLYEAEDLEHIYREGLNIMKQYSLTEENVKSLKERGKSFLIDLSDTNLS